MPANILATVAAPGLVALAVGAATVLSAGGNAATGKPAYDATLTQLSAIEARADAERLFAQADIDGDGSLDANEYAALAVVTAELSRLNGFVAYEIDGEAQIVALPIDSGKALVGTERTRVEAVALRRFYVAAGEDGRLSESELVAERLERFEAADRNRNGELTKNELTALAATDAAVILSRS